MPPRFFNRRDCYPLQVDNGTYITLKAKLSSPLLLDHIQGKITLGAYALDPTSQARWICLDADDDFTWLQLQKMTAHLLSDAIPAYLEPSRRGGHLWLFTPKIPGSTARRFAKQLLSKHNISNVEIYPKQDKLTTGPGSLVRLPFGIHRKTGQRYPFIQLNGQPLAPSIREQMALLSDPQRVPMAFIDDRLDQITEVAVTPPLQLAKVPQADGRTLSERIKASISVWDFVGCYVDLNDREIGFCPFQQDQHVSFGVNDHENYWHCWAG